MSKKSRRQNQLNQLAALQRKLGMGTMKKRKRKNRNRRIGLVKNKVSQPAAQSFVLRRMKDKMTNPRFKRRELVAKFVSDGAGVDLAFHIPFNPGDLAVLTWLPGLARRYEEYYIHNIMFEFVTACATSSTGNVTWAPVYDVLDDPMVDPDHIMQCQDAIQIPVWKSASCMLKGLKKRWLYVKDGNEAFPTKVLDEKTYTAFAINVVCEHNKATGGEIGKFYVTYDVSFRNAVPRQSTIPETAVKVSAIDLSVGGSMMGVVNTYDYACNSTGFDPTGVDETGYTDSRSFEISRPGKYFLEITTDYTDYSGSTTIVDGDVEARTDNGAVTNVEISGNATYEALQGFALTCVLAVAKASYPAIFKLASLSVGAATSYVLRYYQLTLLKMIPIAHFLPCLMISFVAMMLCMLLVISNGKSTQDEVENRFNV